MLEGSQIPVQFRADQRMNELMGRLDSFESPNIGATDSLDQQQIAQQDPKSFKAMVSMMQSQMMSEAFDNYDNKNDDDKKSNPMSSFMDSLMMQNPAMAASMQGQMPNMNNQMSNQMMMQSLLGSGLGSSGIDPSMLMKMAQGMGANPMMATNPFLNNKMPEPQVMPVKGKITSDYGHRHHPISGHDHFHSGVDIAAQKGAPIRSPWSGKVVHVGYVQGFGANTVIVAHENQVQPDGKIIYSVFGHNDKAFVKVGDEIRSGEIFATVGSEGNSTGPHLHWETRVAPAGILGTDIFKQHLSHTVDPMDIA